MTQYLNPTTDQVWQWMRNSLCSWCGNKCGSSSCYSRYCDSCSAYWLADTEADYREFDAGDPPQATVAPRKEECPNCLADKISFDGVTFEVNSDLYQAGVTEDGEPYLAEVYFIRATFRDGSRLEFNTRYRGCEPEQMEEFTYFKDIRTEAKARAESQLERIKKDGAIYRSNWTETYPEYGSQAYCEWETAASPAELGFGGSR
jgi:hypothetical protein